MSPTDPGNPGVPGGPGAPGLPDMPRSVKTTQASFIWSVHQFDITCSTDTDDLIDI